MHSAIPTLSVIIPCRNDAQALKHLLHQLQQQQTITFEVIVADGESTDDSIAVARLAGTKVCSGPPGRGRQMNNAVRHATADMLLFLHADSGFTDPQQLASAVKTLDRHQSKSLKAGHFPLRFTNCDKSQKRWRVLEYKSRSNLPLSISGDQGLLIKKSHFQQLGQFDTSLPFLEDQRLAAELHRNGEWVLLPHPLETSARRFQTQGFVPSYLLMTLIMAAHHIGLKAFLAPAALYPEQLNAGPIKLTPQLKRFYKLCWSEGLFTGLHYHWQLGQLARDNLYQVPLWLEALLSLKHWPLSRFFLRFLQPLLQLPLIREITQLGLIPIFTLISGVLIAANI